MMCEQWKKEYPNDTIKENIPIGTALTTIVLPDGETIIAKAKEASMLDKNVNILFSAVQMEDTHINLNHIDSGERYIDTDG